MLKNTATAPKGSKRSKLLSDTELLGLPVVVGHPIEPSVMVAMDTVVTAVAGKTFYHLDGNQNYDSSDDDSQIQESDYHSHKNNINRLQQYCGTSTTNCDGKPVAHNNNCNATTAIQMDLISNLNPDILCKITSFLDPSGLLLQLGHTNRFFWKMCQENRAGWDHLCHCCWKEKMYILPAAMLESNKCKAYHMAWKDAHERQWITQEELCYDSKYQTIWGFRFKESAGTDWTQTDPWHQGQPCRKLVFMKAGIIREVKASSYTVNPINTAVAENNDLSNSNNNNNRTDAISLPVTLQDPPMRMSWRFLNRPMDLPSRPMGSYLRLSVGGRDVPTYVVRRSPTRNWGFIMESCWGVGGTFELPPRQKKTQKSGSLPTKEEDMQDESMRLTNEIQWREAFLYNVGGARELPEGDQATNEFDRSWYIQLENDRT